ncbi:MAG: [FeFe] hydrogenase H-cluster radical SAM maturase HydE [Kiritimatiellia bacterium]
MNALLQSITAGREVARADLKPLLALTSQEDQNALFKAAYAMKLKHVGPKVHFRGIIEYSNICEKNCYYCGIRRDNKNVRRFQMTSGEIIEAAKWAHQSRYGSIVLQGGERQDKKHTEFIENILREVKRETNGELGITLSLGEQPRETLERWFAAGAHRYLLRIETSSPELYAKLHPADHSHAVRLQCLDDLKAIGYQVGTGVMIGLPGQTLDDLAADIEFFRERDIDMIGMGPYIVHSETPLAAEMPDFSEKARGQLELALRMIAVTRLYLRDVNIASTTALQALDAQGREMGLQAGANIIMPNITDTKYRDAYQLYENKPCLDENVAQCRNCLQRRVESVGETIGFGEWGDSPHFRKRTGS